MRQISNHGYNAQSECQNLLLTRALRSPHWTLLYLCIDLTVISACVVLMFHGVRSTALRIDIARATLVGHVDRLNCGTTGYVCLIAVLGETNLRAWVGARDRHQYFVTVNHVWQPELLPFQD